MSKLSSKVKTIQEITPKEDIDLQFSQLDTKLDEISDYLATEFEANQLQIVNLKDTLNLKMEAEIDKLKAQIEVTKQADIGLQPELKGLPKQITELQSHMNMILKEFQAKKTESDSLLISTYKGLYDSRTPEANIVWTRQLETADPSYCFRGHWRQLSDRLNSASEYNLKNKLVTPIFDLKSQQHFKDVADITMEALEKFFIQHGLLKIANLI